MPTIRNILPGDPEPLGATVKPDGINFAIHSSGATRIELLLFDNIIDREPSQVVPLDPAIHRTEDVWHIFVEGLPNRILYNYRADGPYDPAGSGQRFNANKTLLDPYARAVTGDFDWLAGDALGYSNVKPDDPDRHLRPSQVQNVGGAARCVAYKSDFDWEGDAHPDIPIEQSIIYEVNVRGFTRHHSSESDFGGTYRGFVEKIPHLKDLGITAVEFLPVFEFDQFDGPFRDPFTGERLANAWGYNTIAFFAPESHYSYFGKLGTQIDEFKFLVRELHKHGIEVILDVVFNHTREGNHFGPTVSFRGLDNNLYYLLVPGQPQFYNDWTGCGNTMNCNHPVVRKFILDCLRYWVTEMHVDGFRFDLAAVFAVDTDGLQKGKTPLIHEIETDPVLSRIKLIAEPWSIRQYMLGSFSDRRWAEWNGKFRDTVRKWVKGDPVAGDLATRIAGSYDLFAATPDAERSPYHSINFVACHDGFTLNDLVSYNQKHNERNGENNNDGSNDNESWNCGWEGFTDPLQAPDLTDARRAEIETTRNQQIKNFLTLLFLSQGTPMLLYGDEMRRTAEGDNNTVYQDNTLNWINWENVKRHADILRFTRMIIAFRKRHSIQRTWRYLTDERAEVPVLRSISWHGVKPNHADFSDSSRYLAAVLEAFQTESRGDVPIYVGTNTFWEPLDVELPPTPGKRWFRVVDTSLPSGEDIVTDEEGVFLTERAYMVQPRSTIVLIAR
ncbi:MAG: glycogen debranching enzyme GlgX [Planctomycetota bacterium]|nr:glycogen debranching enzyme GlgX [Planctomycetota bacterium]